MTIEKKQTLTVKNIRTINIENTLHTMIRQRSITRNILAKENGISLMTVKHVADDLIAADIVIEMETNGSEVGRKPKLLELDSRYGHIVCVNLTSKAEISYLVYDIYENLLEEQIISFNEDCSYQETLMMAVSKIKKIQENIPTELVGIAVFVPGAYDERSDLVNYDLIPEFKELHLRTLFEQEFKLNNILVLHDVFADARAEYDSLQPKQESQFYFYCGHGVGGFFIHKDEAVAGEERMAGEVGRMLVAVDASPENRTTFEEAVSIPAVKLRMKEMGAEMTFDRLLELYAADDEKARKVLDPVLELISRMLYNLLWAYNPTKVVIDSCKSKYSELILVHFREFMDRMRDDAIPIHAEIRQAKYDEYHMMRGCFYMVRNAWIEEIAQTL